MLALVLGSLSAPLTYCCVHQRAWMASLDRWVTFHVPTRNGSPSTDAPCDRCAAEPQRVEGVGGHGRWSVARARHNHGEEPWSAAAQRTENLW